MLFIGICGASGSGKSTLSHDLEERLGKNRSLVLQQDAYYRDHPDLTFEERVRLARKPEEIPVGEIIELMEGSLASVACLENDALPCPRAAMCETLPMWKEFDQPIHDFFFGKKLSDLIRKS